MKKLGFALMNNDFRPPYRIPEASRRLGISDQLTRKAIIRGELDAFRLGRTWLIRPDVDRLLRSEGQPSGHENMRIGSVSDPAPQPADRAAPPRRSKIDRALEKAQTHFGQIDIEDAIEGAA